MKSFNMSVIAAFLLVTAFGGGGLLNTDNAAAAEQQATKGGAKIVVTYFRGDIRCATCINLEAYSDEAVEQGFPEEIANGTVEFKTVNIDEEDNRHFVKDYQLDSRSVVVSRIENGKEIKWKNLDMIWHLVGNKEKFMAYIKAETKNMMEGKS
ncbi:MAG: nitrophenyl compound nitroreductase subunit ArsF family protein [Pseudomonadota bacterium]